MFDFSNPNLRRFNSLYALIPLGLVLATVVFVILGRRHPPSAFPPPQAVILAEVLARDVIESSEYTAQMEADLSVELKARVSGFLLRKNFAAGETVHEDQVLFQIEPDQYQALLDIARAETLSAQAQFDRARLDFTRISDLYVKHTSTKSELDAVKAVFETAEGQLSAAQARESQARLNLDYASIKAPFAGRISDTPYSEGSLLGPESGVLASLVSSDPILAVFGISSRALLSLPELSQAAELGNFNLWLARLKTTADDYYPRPGRLVYMAPIVDARTDTVKFKARFENPEGLLRPGQIVGVVLESAAPRRRLLIPKAAALTDAEGSFVYTLREVPGGEGRPGGLAAERRAVVLGRGELEKEFFIEEGLAEGDKIILKGLISGGSTLRPGAPVRLASPEEAAAAGLGGANGAPAGGEAANGEAQAKEKQGNGR